MPALSVEEILLAAGVLAIFAAVLQSSEGALAPSWNVIGRVKNEVHRILCFHDRLTAWISGEHPDRRIWHSQWLPVKDLYRVLRRILPTLRGRLLDVGCRGKPYSRWLSGVDEHVGIDVVPGRAVDFVIRDGEPWPLESGAFQSVLCTQVLAAARDLPCLVREIDRVLEVGGVAVITTPFIYNDMTTTFERQTFGDFRRHTILGVQQLFDDRFEIVDCRRLGGFGSTAGMMFLNWVQVSLSRSGVTLLLLALLLPVWLLVCLFVNLTGWLLDTLDRTDIFYSSVLLVARKKAPGPGTGFESSARFAAEDPQRFA